MAASIEISRGSFLGQAWMLLLGMVGEAGVAKAAAAEPGVASDSAPAPSSTAIYAQEFAAFEHKTDAQKLKELMDREEIRELLGRYAHQTAHGMDVSTLYTDDGAFIVTTPGRPEHNTRGREAMSKLYSTMSTLPQPPKPQIHNSLLVINGDEASGICSNEVRVVENGQSIIGSGYYEDTFRRVKGRWKFVVRHATFYHWVPIQQGWAKSTSPI